MSKAKELRDKFEADLKKLQDDCPHKEVEKIPYMWSPGHNSGDCIVCLECNKILKHLPLSPLKVNFTNSGDFIVTTIESTTRR